MEEDSIWCPSDQNWRGWIDHLCFRVFPISAVFGMLIGLSIPFGLACTISDWVGRVL